MQPYIRFSAKTYSMQIEHMRKRCRHHKNMTHREPFLSRTPERSLVLYQVMDQGRSIAFVCEQVDGSANLYGLLTQGATIMRDGDNSFAGALSLAAAECSISLRPVLADEAEALSHDLGHGGAADLRVVIDMDDSQIRVEYDHRAGSFQECLEPLKRSFPAMISHQQEDKSP